MTEPSWIHSRIAGVDFDSPGKRLYLVSIDYRIAGEIGNIAWPLAVFRNGRGLVVLVAGGTHGDEFEGQAAAIRLIKRLDPAAVKGSLLIVPQLN